MTADEIDFEVKKPSSHWIEAGSGHLGQVFVEVLQCDGLPNLDYSAMGRNKTDPFVTIVFEDSIVHTDVINDCLSPRWMPWAQRAFVLNIIRPTSQIMVGVADFDAGGGHDKIGRAVVNISNCRPGTLYTVQYSLYGRERRKRGVITLRLRVEWQSERSALLAAASLSDSHYVSVPSKQYFRTTYHALANEVCPENCHHYEPIVNDLTFCLPY